MADQAQPTDEVGGDDVRADVLAAFEKHSAPVETEVAEVAAEEVSNDEGKSTRARDEQGRFAKTAAPKETVEPDTTQASKEVTGADKPAEKPAQTSTSDGPPSGWPADAKTLWSQLPPAIQAAVIKREGEISNGGRQWSEEKRRYEEALTPVRAAAQRYGISEHEGLKRLVMANDYLERDPVNAIRWLAQSRGIDLTQLAAAPAAPRVDPIVQSLSQKLNQLEQTLTAREQAEIQTEISTFAKDKPYFDEVRDHMGRLLESGTAESLQDAYDQAVWALPSIRERLLAERETNARAERERVEREKVGKAKKGAVSVTGAPVRAPAARAPEFDSIRDSVKWAFDQHRVQ